MRLHFWLVLIAWGFVFLGFYKLAANPVFGQTMPQQQNCTTTTSGSISHTFCGPPVVVQVAAPAVTVQAPAVTVTPAPVVVPPPPAQPKPEKKIRE